MRFITWVICWATKRTNRISIESTKRTARISAPQHEHLMFVWTQKVENVGAVKRKMCVIMASFIVWRGKSTWIGIRNYLKLTEMNVLLEIFNHSRTSQMIFWAINKYSPFVKMCEYSTYFIDWLFVNSLQDTWRLLIHICLARGFARADAVCSDQESLKYRIAKHVSS